MLNLVYPNVHQYWPLFSSHITETMFLGDLSMTPIFHAVSGHAPCATSDFLRWRLESGRCLDTWWYQAACSGAKDHISSNSGILGYKAKCDLTYKPIYGKDVKLIFELNVYTNYIPIRWNHHVWCGEIPQNHPTFGCRALIHQDVLKFLGVWQRGLWNARNLNGSLMQRLRTPKNIYEDRRTSKNT